MRALSVFGQTVCDNFSFYPQQKLKRLKRLPGIINTDGFNQLISPNHGSRQLPLLEF
jgi:hypothetical protein